MPVLIPILLASVPLLTTLIVLFWISANPKGVEVVGQSIGEAFGQVGKGVGEGVITPLLEYTVLGSLAALAIAVAYKAVGQLTGGGLPAPPTPPGFAPPPQFGGAVGISAGPISGTAGTIPAPLSPDVAAEAAARRQGRAQRGLIRRR